jgi:hypothetical protein
MRTLCADERNTYTRPRLVSTTPLLLSRILRYHTLIVRLRDYCRKDMETEDNTASTKATRHKALSSTSSIRRSKLRTYGFLNNICKAFSRTKKSGSKLQMRRLDCTQLASLYLSKETVQEWLELQQCLQIYSTDDYSIKVEYGTGERPTCLLASPREGLQVRCIFRFLGNNR